MQHEQQGEHRLQTPAKHAQHQHAEQADDDEKERVDDVVRGNHLRFVATFGAVLDDGIKRHGVDAAAKGDGEEGERGADKTRVVPEGGERLRLGNGGVGADGDDARKSGGEDKGADGHQPRFYPPARQQVAEERADADADGKQHQQVGGYCRVAVQNFLRVLRDLCEQRAAEQPEPGDGEDALENRLLPRGVGEQRFGLLPRAERRQRVAVGLAVVGRDGISGQHADDD